MLLPCFVWSVTEILRPGLFRPALLHRLLAHTLVEALWDQLLLDVSGGGGVFTLGDTSRLIGTTVAAAVSGILFFQPCSPSKWAATRGVETWRMESFADFSFPTYRVVYALVASVERLASRPCL